MNYRKQEHGLTLIGWVFVLGLLIFGAMVAMRLAPVYLTHNTIVSVLHSLQEEPLITKQDQHYIRNLITKRLVVNDSDETFDDEALTITTQPGLVDISLDYEVRRPIIGNVDVVLSFHETLQLVGN